MFFIILYIPIYFHIDDKNESKTKAAAGSKMHFVLYGGCQFPVIEDVEDSFRIFGGVIFNN